jgi:hypothetical protein
MATGFTEATGTLTNEAKTPNAAKAGRRGLIVSNNSDAAMVVRFGAFATASAGMGLAAGDTKAFMDPRACPDGLVSIFCAGTSKAFTTYEW